MLACIAYADEEISDAEAARVRALITEHAGLPPAEVGAVVVVAQSRTVALHGQEKHLLKRAFSEVASDTDRRHLIDCLYAVATGHFERQEQRKTRGRRDGKPRGPMAGSSVSCRSASTKSSVRSDLTSPTSCRSTGHPRVLPSRS